MRAEAVSCSRRKIFARSSFVVRPNVAKARLAAAIAPCVFLVSQRDAGDYLTVGRLDDVHDFAAVGFNERSVDVVCGDRLDGVTGCGCLHGGPLSLCALCQNDVTTTLLSEPSLSAA